LHVAKAQALLSFRCLLWGRVILVEALSVPLVYSTPRAGVRDCSWTTSKLTAIGLAGGVEDWEAALGDHQCWYCFMKIRGGLKRLHLRRGPTKLPGADSQRKYRPNMLPFTVQSRAIVSELSWHGLSVVAMADVATDQEGQEQSRVSPASLETLSSCCPLFGSPCSTASPRTEGSCAVTALRTACP
jgi:hypothetical protein